MKYDNIITKEQLLDRINERIDHYKVRLELFNQIEPVIKEFDGKKITKRIQTKLRKKLSKRVVYLNKDYSMFQLVIWGITIYYSLMHVRYILMIDLLP